VAHAAVRLLWPLASDPRSTAGISGSVSRSPAGVTIVRLIQAPYG